MLMMALIRLRIVGLFLALAFGLGGIVGAFAQRMPTVDDLAIVEAMAMGATPADICGKDGKSLFAEVAAKATHASDGSILPPHRPPSVRIALRVIRLAASEPQVHAPKTESSGHESRAPPIALI